MFLPVKPLPALQEQRVRPGRAGQRSPPRRAGQLCALTLAAGAPPMRAHPGRRPGWPCAPGAIRGAPARPEVGMARGGGASFVCAFSRRRVNPRFAIPFHRVSFIPVFSCSPRVCGLLRQGFASCLPSPSPSWARLSLQLQPPPPSLQGSRSSRALSSGSFSPSISFIFCKF